MHHLLYFQFSTKINDKKCFFIKFTFIENHTLRKKKPIVYLLKHFRFNMRGYFLLSKSLQMHNKDIYFQNING